MTSLKDKTSSGNVESCLLCQKTNLTATTKSVHLKDNHDGQLERIFPLKCWWCKADPITTRKGLAKHLLVICAGVANIQFPVCCPFCNTTCQRREDLSKHGGACSRWQVDASSDEVALDEFDQEVMRVTRHAATARLFGDMFEKAEVRLPDGEKAFAFIIPRGSKRLMSGSKAHVHILKRRAAEVDENIKLDTALSSHAYGRLVCIEDYMVLDNTNSFWHQPFTDNGERLAMMFDRMMIQSGNDILLVLKVEMYGTDNYEDPHSQELAKPEGNNAFKVENVLHDHLHKVMVGAVKWCLLVTMAVMLTDGTVVVGPDNKIFYPKASSTVLIKNKPRIGCFNTMPRQVRSKYDEEATLHHFSAVDPLFNHHETMPVTLKTLYRFKMKSAWSGIKVAAFVFHQLYTKEKIVKAEVRKYSEEALSVRGGKSCETLRIVDCMIQVMGEEEVFPVSKPVNKHLTELAGKLSGEITSLNTGEVKDAVERKIKRMNM